MSENEAGEPRRKAGLRRAGNGPRYPAAAGSEPEGVGPAAPVRSVFLV